MSARFGILTFAGLGSLAAAELSRCKPTGFHVCRLTDHDFVLADIEAKGSRGLPALRIAEDIFCMLGPGMDIRSGTDLEKLGGLVSADAVLEGVRIKNALFHPPKPRITTHNCFVKQDRDRRVRRKQIAARVNDLVASHFRKWKQSDPAAVELWGFYVKESLHLGVRLSDEKMRYRGDQPPKRTGALRPTIAAALVYLADPGEGELIVDPMCGSGTILREGLAFNTKATYAGGDTDCEAVAVASEALAGKGVEVREWDAADLPLESGTVDCFVCNLPFGKQYSSPERNRSLYPALLSNWAEKLKPGGRMVLLTADTGAIEGALNGLGLTWRSEHRAKVLGTWTGIYTVRRK